MKKLMVLLAFLLFSFGGYSQVVNPLKTEPAFEIPKISGKRHLASGIFAGTSLVMGSIAFVNSDLNGLNAIGNTVLGCLGLSALIFVAENKVYRKQARLQVSGNNIGLAFPIP